MVTTQAHGWNLNSASQVYLADGLRHRSSLPALGTAGKALQIVVSRQLVRISSSRSDWREVAAYGIPVLPIIRSAT
jgi:hypothetical protein